MVFKLQGQLYKNSSKQKINALISQVSLKVRTSNLSIPQGNFLSVIIFLITANNIVEQIKLKVGPDRPLFVIKKTSQKNIITN